MDDNPLEIPENSGRINKTETYRQEFGDEAYNAYLKMMDEVDHANQSGMSARDFAKKQGVPSSLSDAQAKILDDFDFKMLDEGKGKTTFKFSEMTLDDVMKIAQEYRTKAPIEIPESATIKPASKTGYEQISYKWRDSNYKYEVRWHTRTPGAPENQGNTWVVERTTPGSGGTGSKTEIFSGNQWVSGYEWFKAIRDYQNGTATSKQLKLLEEGHWKE